MAGRGDAGPSTVPAEGASLYGLTLGSYSLRVSIAFIHGSFARPRDYTCRNRGAGLLDGADAMTVVTAIAVREDSFRMEAQEAG